MGERGAGLRSPEPGLLFGDPSKTSTGAPPEDGARRGPRCCRFFTLGLGKSHLSLGNLAFLDCGAEKTTQPAHTAEGARDDARKHWAESSTQCMASIVLAVTNEQLIKKTRSAPTRAQV